MKANRLAFDQLQQEMEVLEVGSLREIKGGADATQWEWAIDPAGGVYYRMVGTEEWISWLNQIEVVNPLPNSFKPQEPYANMFGDLIHLGDILPPSGNSGGGGGGFGIATLYGTTTTVQLSQSNTVFASSLGDQLTYTTYAGQVFGQAGFINTNTTFDNGVLKSYDFSLHNITFSLTTNGGMSISSASTGFTTTLGLSTEGLSYGVSLAGPNGSFTGSEYTFMPGGWTAIIVVGGVLCVMFPGAVAVAALAL